MFNDWLKMTDATTKNILAELRQLPSNISTASAGMRSILSKLGFSHSNTNAGLLYSNLSLGIKREIAMNGFDESYNIIHDYVSRNERIISKSIEINNALLFKNAQEERKNNAPRI